MNKSIRDRLLRLLFPEPVGCLVCRAETEGSFLCQDCLDELYRNGPRQCEVCGRTIQMGEVCSICRTHHFPELCRSIRILYRYDGTARRAIRRAKFYGSRYSAEAMARLFIQEIRRMEEKPDALIYIPSHPLRVLLRGYSAMGLVIRLVSDATGIPIEKQALRRVRYSRPQASQSTPGRAHAVQGAFALGKFSGKYQHYLLLDDVCTSGSTLREVLTLLNNKDAISVLVLAGHED